MKTIARKRIEKEIKKRSAISNGEKNERFHRFIEITTHSKQNRYRVSCFIFRRKNYARISHCRNHCFISGRAHSIYKQFRLTRNMVRVLAHKGYIYGLVKASWLWLLQIFIF